MTRPLSNTAREAVLTTTTAEALLMLLDIEHDDIDTIRVVNNRDDVVYDGNTYTAYPFDITLPRDSEDSPPEVTLTIENIDRVLVEAVMTITTPPTFTLYVALYDDPITSIEAGPFEFTAKSVDFDAAVMTARLGYESILYEPYPAVYMTPRNFPGIFGGVAPGTTWIVGPGESGISSPEITRGEPKDRTDTRRRPR